MHKRGQFFLITALVLVAILISLGSMYTIFKTPPEKCYMVDLAKELQAEGNSVVSSSINSFSASPTQVEQNLNDIIETYSEDQRYANTEIAVVYISPDLNFAQYYSCDSSISSGFGDGSETRETCNKLATPITVVPDPTDPNKMSITLDGNTYTFTPTSDSYFYLVLSTTQGYQHTVVTSDKTGSGACI